MSLSKLSCRREKHHKPKNPGIAVFAALCDKYRSRPTEAQYAQRMAKMKYDWDIAPSTTDSQVFMYVTPAAIVDYIIHGGR